MRSKILQVFLISFILAGAVHPVSLRSPVPEDKKSAGKTPAGHSLFARQYHEGEKLGYHMKGINEGWSYDIQAMGIVKSNPAGIHYEEYQWGNLVFSGKTITLPQPSVDFRQQLSLDPEFKNAVPSLATVHPMLIGPITDLLTFYSDLWLAVRTGKLTKPGDHFRVAYGVPTSWADGHRVLFGEDSIDFDLTLAELTPGEKALVIVRHVPPQEPGLKFPADWMHQPVSDAPNNWAVVEKLQEGKYLAQVGKETFDVRIQISLADGKISSAVMENPIDLIERECKDAALADCGAPRRREIKRHIEMSLQP
jgi:hypothetical protein